MFEGPDGYLSLNIKSLAITGCTDWQQASTPGASRKIIMVRRVRFRHGRSLRWPLIDLPGLRCEKRPRVSISLPQILSKGGDQLRAKFRSLSRFRERVRGARASACARCRHR